MYKYQKFRTYILQKTDPTLANHWLEQKYTFSMLYKASILQK